MIVIVGLARPLMCPNQIFHDRTINGSVINECSVWLSYSKVLRLIGLGLFPLAIGRTIKNPQYGLTVLL